MTDCRRGCLRRNRRASKSVQTVCSALFLSFSLFAVITCVSGADLQGEPPMGHGMVKRPISNRVNSQTEPTCGNRFLDNCWIMVNCANRESFAAKKNCYNCKLSFITGEDEWNKGGYSFFSIHQ